MTTPTPGQGAGNSHQRRRDEDIRLAIANPARGGWMFHGAAKVGIDTGVIQHFHPYRPAFQTSRAICGAWWWVIYKPLPRTNSRVPRCRKCEAVVERAVLKAATHEAHAAGVHARWGAGPGCPECESR